MYNDHDRLSLVECDPVHIGFELLEALVEMLSTFPGWAVHFSIGDSGIRVYSDAILVGGRRFWDTSLAEQVADRCARSVDYGAPTPLHDPMYRLWLAMISGEFKPSMSDSDLSERQWVEAVRILRDISGRRANRNSSAFDYDQVRYDLHPETRRQLVLRLLAEIGAFAVMLPSAIRNIEKDSAEALLNSSSEVDQKFVSHQISLAQQVLRHSIEIKEVVLWWPNVIHYVRGADPSLRRSLISELFSIAVGSDPLIRISGIFGLALLRIEGLASIIDESIKAFPVWTANEPLMKWLGQLKAGSSSYPDRVIFEKWNVLTTVH